MSVRQWFRRSSPVLPEVRHTKVVRWEAAPSVPAPVPSLSSVGVVEYLSDLPMGEMAESSNPWHLSLVEANMVVGGIPGSGKSVFVNGLIAHLAVHPHVEIGFIDLSTVEVHPWKDRLSAVATEQKGSASLIKWMLADCEARYTRMESLGIKNAWTQGFLGEAEPVKVLVIDESTALFRANTREGPELVDQMKDDLASLMSIGRLAGFVVTVATQKPSVSTLPSAIRDIATVRIAFRCKMYPASIAASVLGDNFALDDPIMSPTKITEAQRGQAITVLETGELQRVQCALIDDTSIGIAGNAPWSGHKWAVSIEGEL